jgi:hypothetical protein
MINMKRLLLMMAAITCFVALSVNGIAATITFEDVGTGSYSSIVYSDVTFTNNLGNLNVMDVTSTMPPLANHVIFGPDTHNSAEAYKAAFSITGVRSVSVDMGDWNADADSLYLKAYDAGNNLLNAAYDTLPWTLNGGHTLAVTTSADISYVLFNTDYPYPGSVFCDNFIYTANPVPLPSALLLFAPGLAGLAALRRRFLK